MMRVTVWFNSNRPQMTFSAETLTVIEDHVCRALRITLENAGKGTKHVSLDADDVRKYEEWRV